MGVLARERHLEQLVLAQDSLGGREWAATVVGKGGSDGAGETHTHTHTLTHTQRERRQMPVVDEGEFTKTRCPFVVSGGGSSRFGADKTGAWLTAFRITPHTGLPRLLLVMS